MNNIEWKGGWLGVNNLSIMTYYLNEVVSYNNITYIATSIRIPIGSPIPPLDMGKWDTFVSGQSGSSGAAGTSGTSGTSGESAINEVYYEAFTGITKGAAVRLGQNGKIYPMNFVGLEEQPIIGIAQSSGATNSIVNVAIEGGLSTALTGLTPSFNYYASNNGSISLTGETFIGTAVKSDTILVSFSNPTGPITPSLSVIDNTITNPNNITTPGRYIVPASGTTSGTTTTFIGKENNYTDYNGEDFTYTIPTNGDKAVITTGSNAGNVYLFTSGATSGWTISSQTTTLTTSNWSSSIAYKQFDLVIYQNFLYQANSNIPANTAFTIGSTGATWKPINNGVVAEYNAVYATNNSTTNSSTFVDLPGATLTLPSAGVYRVYYNMTTFSSGDGTVITFAISNSSNTIYDGSYCNGAKIYGSLYSSNASHELNISVNTPTTIKLRWRVSTGSATFTLINNTNSNSVFGYEKISGFAPVVGQTSDYIYATRTTAQTTGISIGSPILFTSSNGNIPLNTTNGQFTLSPGKTYQLQGMLGGANINRGIGYRWRDVTNNVLIGQEGAIVTPSATNSNVVGGSIAAAIITPTSTITVRLEIVNGLGVTLPTSIGFTQDQPDSAPWANITQLGTTNTSAFTGVISPSWNIDSTYPLGTIVINGDSMYQANSLIVAGTPFATGLSGATWKPINGGGVIPEYGEQNLATNFDYASGVSGAQILITFSLPTAGVWDVNYIANVFATSGNLQDNFDFYLIDSSGNVINNSNQRWQSDTNANDASSVTSNLLMTTNGPSTYRLVTTRVSTGTILVYANGTKVVYTKISGFAPVLGSTTGFASALKTANQTINNNTTNITFETITGNITQLGGAFTLNAGATYQLNAGIITTNISNSMYQWYDITNNIWLGNPQTAMSPVNGSTLAFTGGIASATITPSSSIQVAFRQRISTNGNQITNNDYTTTDIRAWANISQLGTTNTSAFTGVVSPSWNISNTYPIGSIVVNGNSMYQANSLIVAGTAFTTGLSGATWKSLNAITDWVSAGTIQVVGISGTTSSPTLPTTTLRNNISYKQLGPKTWQVTGTLSFTSATGASDGSGDYLFTLPNALQFDLTLPNQQAWQGDVGVNNASTYRNQLSTSSMTYSRISDNFASASPSGIIIWDSTRYRISINNNAATNRCWGSAHCQLTGPSGCSWQFTFQTP